MACRHRNVHEKAAATCSRRYFDDEDIIQCTAGAVARQRKAQCTSRLLAQLPGLLFYPSTSVSPSMLGFLQGSLKFRIEWGGCNVTLASVF
jgi:hypothetical protein